MELFIGFDKRRLFAAPPSLGAPEQLARQTLAGGGESRPGREFARFCSL